MDQEKVGKFIAKLRREQGLTQRELGDKVGIGYRSVSKWERGLTSPDISIINELSEILKVTSDELLKGERSNKTINNTNNNNNSFLEKHKTKIIIALSLTIIMILTTFIIGIINNKTYTYNIESADENYVAEGKLMLHKNEISIIINKLIFLDKEFASTIIENYEYSVYINNTLLFRRGSIEIMPEPIDSLDKENTIETIMKDFTINYSDDIVLKKTEVLNKKLTIRISFLTNENNIVTKEINMTQKPIK